MIKGFRNILEKARAFDPGKLVTARVILPDYQYSDFDKRRAYFDRALETLQATPGVAAACLFTTPPFSNNGTRWKSFSIQSVEAGKRLPGAVGQARSPGVFPILFDPLASCARF